MIRREFEKFKKLIYFSNSRQIFGQKKRFEKRQNLQVKQEEEERGKLYCSVDTKGTLITFFLVIKFFFSFRKNQLKIFKID